MTGSVPPNRRSVRLRDYDYRTPGGYFITICTSGRQALFADLRMRQIIEVAWTDIPNHHPYIEIDEFVVMPNHVHGILFLGDRDATADRAQQAAPLQHARPRVEAGALGAIVRSFKARVTRDLRRLAGSEFIVWQRNYHEHIIRDEGALRRIRQYIVDNPTRWSFDRENPAGRPDAVEREFDYWLSKAAPPVVGRAEVAR